MTHIHETIKRVGHWLFILIMVTTSYCAVAQTKITSTSSTVSGIKVPGEVTGTNVNIQYLDRFGRPIQTVGKKATPNQKDIVNFSVFDSYGRALKSYLPYPTTNNTGAYRTNALSEQSSFYNAGGTVSYGTTTAPYSEVDIEESPFKRPLIQGGVGVDYQLNTTHTTKYSYGLNLSSDNVYILEVNGSGLLQNATGTYYAANKLTVTTVKDPNWVSGNAGTTKTFTDYQGRTILTRTYNTSETYDTYYVYDDFNNVRFIVSPEAVRLIIGGATINTTFQNLWLFINEYDTKNRLVSKKAPGIEPVHYVYDKSGRLIMSQDGVQRLSNKWTFTKYDRFDRPILTGEVVDARNRDALTAHVASYIIAGNWYEEKGTARHGYTNNVFPTTPVENDYLVVSYYDDYDFKSSWGSTYNYQANSVNTASAEVRTPGQETGGKIRKLDDNTWFKSVKYYDENGQLIQSVADHHLGYTERFYAAYNYVGDITQSRVESKINSAKTVTINERFVYDQVGRMLQQYHSVDDEPEIILANYKYNELGELIETNIHSSDDGISYAQSIDNRYDEQGRLTHINNADRNYNAANNNDSNDQFGMELYYDSSPSGFGFSAQWNGNLAGATWSHGAMGTIDQRGYAYTYDKVNRLTAATYKEKDNGSWNIKNGHFDVGVSSYDYNGNIKNLTRKATISGAASTVDNLSYTYNGNQLKSVNDLTSYTQGFKDGAELATEYTYDANGNLITDSNKLITSITYNQLNRPNVVTFSNGDKITYKYDASGARLSQEITTGGQTNSYLYLGGMILTKEGASAPELAEIAHPMGRLKAEVIGTYYSYDYQYFLTDHLGNVRVMVAPLQRTYIAGMELDRDVQERAQFENISQTRYNGYADSGTQSAYLNGTSGKQIGPARALAVYSGDVITMQVRARYSSNTSSSSANSVFISALASAFGGSSGGAGELGQIYNGINLGLPDLNSTKSGGNRPRAYLNYLFFNSDYIYQSSGFAELTGSANVYQTLSKTFTANTNGYLFVYVSHEGAQSTNVYFDNLQIVHTSSDAVLQADDYYPFGLPMNNNFLEAGVEPNRFMYQGKQWQTELGLNLYDFHARQFDPALGRWLATDPQSQFMSPYLGMGNMPTLVVDPDGEFGFIAAGIALIGAINSGIHSRKNGDGFFSGFFQSIALSAVSAGFAAGVGESLGAVGGLGKEIGRAALHAGSSGFSSVLGGGNFWSGAGAGAVSSGFGSGFNNADPLLQIAGSSLSGGLAAEIGGGDFLWGAAQGGLISAENHIKHSIQSKEGIDKVFNLWLRRSRRAGQALARLNAVDRMKAFVRLVQTDGSYDLKNSIHFKDDLRKHLKLDSETSLEDRTFIYRGKGGYQLQDLGNYSFGVLANAAGYSNDFAQFGAGIYQIKSGTSSPKWRYSALGGRMLFGDDPRDAYFIQLGYQHVWK